MNDPPEDSLVLPKSHVLSYFTTHSTPTRVRRLARIGLRVTAIFHALISALFGVLVGAVAYDAVSRGKPFSRILADADFLILLMFLSATCGIIQWCLSNAVERGRKYACAITHLTVLAAALAAIFSTVIPVVLGTEFYRNENHGLPLRLGVFLVAMIFFIAQCVGVLFIYDLSVFIQWIHDNPTAEKPPVKFI